MTDYPEWFKKEAMLLAEDKHVKLGIKISWAAKLLIVKNGPMEDRIELMKISDELIELWPQLHTEQLHIKPETLKSIKERNIDVDNSGISETDRIDCMSKIENRFKNLCNRNSIEPDKSVNENMKEDVKKTLLEIKQVCSPLELRMEKLREKMESTLKSAMKANGADNILGIDEWKRLGKEYAHLAQITHKINFLGPDAIDKDEYE